MSVYVLADTAQLVIGLIAPTLSSAAAFAAMESLTGRDARKQREFIQGAFSRYISPKLVEQLVKSPERMKLEGERRGHLPVHRREGLHDHVGETGIASTSHACSTPISKA